jgi:predicted Zn-ribbon and HTH transcriptional regulator
MGGFHSGKPTTVDDRSRYRIQRSLIRRLRSLILDPAQSRQPKWSGFKASDKSVARDCTCPRVFEQGLDGGGFLTVARGG